MPRNLHVSGTTEDSITLKWDRPESDGGSAINSYVVDRRESHRFTWSTVGTVRDTHCTARRLTAGTNYIFRVVAQNDVGYGDGAETAEGVAPKAPFTVPGAPTQPQASHITKEGCVLEWNAPVSDGGSSIIGYTIERCAHPGMRWLKIVSEPQTSTTYKVTGLVEDNEYQFRVYAVNKAGESMPSDPSFNVVAREPFGE